ncbi:hypothetical protein [Bauldia litoralis]|uniref:hypothetical protein n=1 Tax=Bauldia litoralis TaxID=665467 RepID=UPI0032679EFC
MTTSPILFQYEGDGAFTAMLRFRPRCDAEFVVHEVYRLDRIDERSEASHGHYFATLNDKWMSLPDKMAVSFPTVEALRKHALIMCGFRRERKFAMSSKIEARKLAAQLKPQFPEDDYTIISVHDTVVVEWKAISQSRQAMPEKGQFQRSKQAVLDWIDDLLGIPESGGPAPATAPDEAGAPSEEDAHVESESETANGKTRAKDGAGQVPVLSDGHRRALQKFHATLSGFEQDTLVDKERDKFVTELRIHEGDPLSEAMKAVLSAHRYRIAGKANAADCDRILDETINPKIEELA